MLHLQGVLSSLQTTMVNGTGILAQVDPSVVADAMASAGVKTSTTPEGLIWSSAALFIAGGIAWYYNRRNKSADAVTDASNDFKVDTLKDARDQISALTTEVVGLRKANTEMFDQLRANNITMLQSEAAAERMRNEARIANDAADTAKLSLTKVNALMEEIQGINRAQAIYIMKLQETMRAHGVSYDQFDPGQVAVTPA